MAAPADDEPRPDAEEPGLDDAAAPPSEVDRRLYLLTRDFLAATAVGCGCGALLLALALQQPGRWLAAAAFALVAALAWAARALPLARMQPGVVAVQLLQVTCLTSVGPWLGWGLMTPGLMFIGLLVCMLCATAGMRAGVLLAVWSAALVVLIPLLRPGDAASSTVPPLALQLGTQLLQLAAGLAAGWLLSLLMKRGMRAAEAREQRFRRLLALAADGYWEIDAQYRLTTLADDRAAAGLDVARQRAGPAPWHGLQPWELPQWLCDADTFDVMLADLDGRLPFRELPLQWHCTDGSQRALLVSGEPRFDGRGVFTGYWGVVRDVTAEQQARRSLHATETRYRELFSRMPTPLVLHRQGIVYEANPAALALLGQPDPEGLVGRDLLSFLDEDSQPRARQRLELLHGQPLGTALPVVELKLALQAGRRLSISATAVWVDAEGGPATLSILVDDTQRLAASEALRRSEAMLSTLVANSPDPIMLIAMDGARYVMVNRSFERTTGWTAEQAVGRGVHELGPGDPAGMDALLRRVRELGSVSDWPLRYTARDGTSLLLLVAAASLSIDGQQHMVATARDVTDKERNRMEREAILANASIGIALTRNGRIELVNPHAERIFGWPPGTLIGQSPDVMWRDPIERDTLLAGVRPIIESGKPAHFECVAQRKDGSTFTASIRGHAIDPRQPLQAGLVWIVEDVTERRQAEQALARARDEAEAANRAKSVFLANTSHELRTPLNGLIGLSRLARDDGLEPDRRRHYLEQIELSAQSLAGIISDILDLSRIEAGKLPIERAPFDLHAEMQALQRTYGVLAEARGLRLRVDVTPELALPVLGDALRVRQVVSNYLVNALKFTAQGSVRLRARRLPAPRNDTVHIEVQDSGPGIATDTLTRLFRPFTQADDSTTRRYGGTGLGLSICRELATLMGGQVGAESQEGQGSSFWVELPLPPANSGPPVPPARPPRRDLSGLRVLVAEDNPVNMLICVALLERWGVQVEQVPDGREAVAAVARAARDGQPCDAVLMDVHMPVMSGREAARVLRAAEAGNGARPLPIIALTAAALVTERDEALAAGMSDFLTKPIDAERLRDALQRWCIDGAVAPAAAPQGG